jgi:hypothetical protein
VLKCRYLRDARSGGQWGGASANSQQISEAVQVRVIERGYRAWHRRLLEKASKNSPSHRAPGEVLGGGGHGGVVD